MEPITITVRFDLHGQATPLDFTWRGQNYRVESTGRRWQASDGQHLMILTSVGRMFELLFASDGRWSLSPGGLERMAA